MWAISPKLDRFKLSAFSDKATSMKFGFTFSTLAILLGLHSSYAGKSTIAFYLAGLILFAISIITPQILAPFCSLWLRFGSLINTITSPILLGIIYFALMTPIAIIFKVLRRDSLKLLDHPDIKTNWVSRQATDKNNTDMKDPF